MLSPLPGQLRTTMLVDAHIQLLADAPRPLAHNTQVDFYSGSQEVSARIRLLDVEELQPGQSAWVQLRLSKPCSLSAARPFYSTYSLAQYHHWWGRSR